MVAFISKTKYLTSFVPATAMPLINKVNAAAITLQGLGEIPAACLRVLSLAPPQEYYSTATAIPVTLELEYRPQGFKRKLANKGFQAWYKDKNGTVKKGKLVGIRSQQPIPIPVPLDGYGRPLVRDDVTVNDPLIHPTDPWGHTHANPLPEYVQTATEALTSGGYRLPWEIYDEADFTALATMGF